MPRPDQAASHDGGLDTRGQPQPGDTAPSLSWEGKLQGLTRVHAVSGCLGSTRPDLALNKGETEAQEGVDQGGGEEEVGAWLPPGNQGHLCTPINTNYGDVLDGGSLLSPLV